MPVLTLEPSHGGHDPGSDREGPSPEPASPAGIDKVQAQAPEVTRTKRPRTLASVGEELKAGSATVTIAGAALKATGRLLRQLKRYLLAAAQATGDGRKQIQESITALCGEIDGLAHAACVNGINLLIKPPGSTASDQSVSIVAALSRGASGGMIVGAIDVNRSVTALFGTPERPGVIDQTIDGEHISIAGIDITALSHSAVDQARLDRFIGHLDAAIVKVNAAASYVSIARSRISLQASFIASLTEAMEDEPPPPVDSDLDHDSARKAAFETRRLLGAHSLSIANQNSQTILKLFPEADAAPKPGKGS